MFFFRFSLHFRKLYGIIYYHEHKGELRWRRDFIGKWNLTADTMSITFPNQKQIFLKLEKFMCAKVVSIQLTIKSNA